MGWEHEPEIVWRAQERYCVDRLSFERVARELGVAASTLKRWSEKYDWRQKREDIAQAEAEIRADKIRARAKTVKALLDKPSASMAFAVSSLEAQALKEEEAARQYAIRSASDEASVSIATPAEAVAALRRAVEQKLGALLSRPEEVDFKAVQDVQKSLALISQLEAAQPDASTVEGGITAELADRIAAAMSGDL